MSDFNKLAVMSLDSLNRALINLNQPSASDRGDAVNRLVRLINSGQTTIDNIKRLSQAFPNASSNAIANAGINSSTNASSPAVMAELNQLMNDVRVLNASTQSNDSRISVLRQDITDCADAINANKSANALASAQLLNEISESKVELSNALKAINSKIQSAQSLDYGIVNETIRTELNNVFSSFRSTKTETELQVIANSIPTFNLVRADSIFDCTKYDHNGMTIDFGSMMVAQWGDANCPELVDDYMFDPMHLHNALIAINDRIPVNCWLAGERGTGKTNFVEQLANRLQRRLFKLNCHRDMRPADFLGSETIKNGTIEFKPKLIATAIQHPGAIILLDEVSASDENSLIAMHPMLEKSPQRGITFPESNIKIPVGDYVAFFAADNTNGYGNHLFAGTTAMNTAFIDRFAYTMNFEYMDAAKESALIAGRSGLPLTATDKIVQFANVAREKARNGVLTQPPSIRQLLVGSMSLHQPMQKQLGRLHCQQPFARPCRGSEFRRREAQLLRVRL
jgi:nitric oxide reductase NorQ protein